VHHYHKDGPMRFFDNNTNNPDAYYEPNSFDGPKDDKRYAEPALPLSGEADRYNHRHGNDDYTQAGNLFRLLNAEQRQRLFNNIAAAMRGVPEEIKHREIALFAKCDPSYGAGVTNALKLDPPSNDDRSDGISGTARFEIA
jgi:catalase